MSKKQLNRSRIAMQSIYKVDNYICYVLLLVIGVMPLLLRGKIVNFVSPKIAETILSSGAKVDFFTYYKWIFLIILAIAALSLFIYKIIKYGYNVVDSYINIPVFILLILALMAALLAKYKYIALVGTYDRHDGLITFICSLLLFFIAANIKIENKYLSWIMYALGLVTIVNTAMGVANFYGYQIIKNPVLGAIIVPKAVNQAVTGYVMATLNNPNYVAGTGATLTILFLSIAVFASDIKNKVVSIILAVLAFGMILVGLSSGGFLALILIGVVLIAVGLIVKGWKALIPVVIVGMLCSGIFILFNNHNPQIKTETLGGLKYIIPVKSSLVITPVAMAATVQDKPDINENHFELPKAAISKGSGRVYIWKKTMELIKQKPLLGYGFDNYPYVFPQYDKEKIAGVGSYESMVSKPHNMFLGMACNAGIPFLLTFLTLIGFYLFDTLKVFRKLKRVNNNDKKEPDYWSIAIMLFIITYLAQGMVNDPIIATSPIFWVLLGMGVSLNRGILERE